MKKHSKNMTWANKLTLSRIVMMPIVVIALLTAENFWWPFALYFIAAMTDVLDGSLARARNERTVLGSYLDPVADKLLMVSVYLTFSFLHIIPVWVFVIIFSRDLFILLGWNILAILTRNLEPAPRLLGKSATLLQMLTAGVFLLPHLHFLREYLLWPMVLVTCASALDYVWVGAQRLNDVA